MKDRDPNPPDPQPCEECEEVECECAGSCSDCGTPFEALDEGYDVTNGCLCAVCYADYLSCRGDRANDARKDEKVTG